MPLLIVFFGFLFNILNVNLQAWWIYALSPSGRLSVAWLTDFRFIAGIGIFYAGYAIHRVSDRELHTLRRSSETEYGVPKKGLYRLVSCPTYLGEIIEWFGWALAVWSWAGLLFALWTFANLLPRAKAHHQWYKEQFSDYPLYRKALIPFLY